jgi:hypothetical protein
VGERDAGAVSRRVRQFLLAFDGEAYSQMRVEAPVRQGDPLSGFRGGRGPWRCVGQLESASAVDNSLARLAGHAPRRCYRPSG